MKFLILAAFVFLSTNLCATDKQSEFEKNNTLYQKAKVLADTGNVSSMHDVFVIFYTTYPSLKENIQEAVKYLIKAAELGSADAQYYMGYLQQIGDVFQQDLESAVFWLKKADAQEHKMASLQLGFAYLELHSKQLEVIELREESLSWFEKSAQMGNVAGMTQFGIGLLSSRQDEKSFKVAETSLIKASNLGDKSAMLYLGMYYEIQVESGKKEAKGKMLKYFKLAAKHGNSDAKQWLLENESYEF